MRDLTQCNREPVADRTARVMRAARRIAFASMPGERRTGLTSVTSELGRDYLDIVT
jgi:hypothetical protein